MKSAQGSLCAEVFHVKIFSEGGRDFPVHFIGITAEEKVVEDMHEGDMKWLAS